MRILPLLAILGSSVAVGQVPTSRVIGAQAAEEIPDGEKVRLGGESLKAMRTILKTVMRYVDEAKGSRDVVKLNCVNEKLAQVQGLLRISEQSELTLKEAIARADRTTSAHEFTKLAIAREKADGLRVETEQCIGQLAFRTDETVQVDMNEPSGLPPDPSRPPAVDTPMSRPQPASPLL